MALFNDVGLSMTIQPFKLRRQSDGRCETKSLCVKCHCYIVPYMNPFSTQADVHREQLQEVFIIFKNLFTKFNNFSSTFDQLCLFKNFSRTFWDNVKNQ